MNCKTLCFLAGQAIPEAVFTEKNRAAKVNSAVIEIALPSKNSLIAVRLAVCVKACFVQIAAANVWAAI